MRSVETVKYRMRPLCLNGHCWTSQQWYPSGEAADWSAAAHESPVEAPKPPLAVHGQAVDVPEPSGDAPGSSGDGPDWSVEAPSKPWTPPDRPGTAPVGPGNLRESCRRPRTVRGRPRLGRGMAPIGPKTPRAPGFFLQGGWTCPRSWRIMPGISGRAPGWVDRSANRTQPMIRFKVQGSRYKFHL